jgi:hypothetical protein
MTRLGFSTDATEAGAVYIYFLDNITGGTQNVAMTTTGTAAKYLSANTMTVAASTKVSVAGTGYETAGSTSAANPALTLTGFTASVPLVAYEVIHSGLQTMTSTPQTTPAWTLIQAVDIGTTGFGMARIANTPGGTTLTAGWIAATADDYVISGVAFFEDTKQTLTVAGIADTGGVGTPVTSVGAVTLTATGIADTGGVGTPVANVIQNLTVTGIATSSAMGTPVLNAIQTLTVGGIADTGGVGTPVANVIQNLNTAGGIATASAVGTPSVAYGNVMYVAGIASGSALGTPVASSTATMTVTGIATSSAVGTPLVNAPVTLLVASIDASTPSPVGTPSLSTTATLSVTGIATASVVPSPVLAQVEEAWGFLQLI